MTQQMRHYTWPIPSSGMLRATGETMENAVNKVHPTRADAVSKEQQAQAGNTAQTVLSSENKVAKANQSAKLSVVGEPRVSTILCHQNVTTKASTSAQVIGDPGSKHAQLLAEEHIHTYVQLAKENMHTSAQSEGVRNNTAVQSSGFRGCCEHFCSACRRKHAPAQGT